jgi:hypothetical protein
MKNPNCEKSFVFDECSPGEVRLLKKLDNRGFDRVCRNCFNNEIAWRESGHLYTALHPAPKWEELKIWRD